MMRYAQSGHKSRTAEIDDKRLCCEVIMDAVENGHLPEGAFTAPLDIAGLWSANLARVGTLLRSLRTKKKKGKNKYRRHMFSNIDTDYVDERIRRFQDCLGRFHGMRSKRDEADP